MFHCPRTTDADELAIRKEAALHDLRRMQKDLGWKPGELMFLGVPLSKYNAEELRLILCGVALRTKLAAMGFSDIKG